MGDNGELLAAAEAAFRSGDMRQVEPLLERYATDDFVQEWPQSGERLSKALSAQLSASYQEQSGTSPRLTFRRLLSGGDLFVVEGTVDYGDGVPVGYVGIGEIRDGKVFRMTEYFANPFEPPAWRAGITERMDTVTA